MTTDVRPNDILPSTVTVTVNREDMLAAIGALGVCHDERRAPERDLGGAAHRLMAAISAAERAAIAAALTKDEDNT